MDDEFDDDEDFGLGDDSAQAQEVQLAQHQNGTIPAETPSGRRAGAFQQSLDEFAGETDLYVDIAGGLASGSVSADTPRLQSGSQAGQQPSAQAGPGSASAKPPRTSREGSGNAAQLDGQAGSAIFVGNLHWWTTDADVDSACAEFGTVTAIEFTEEKSNGRSKGYARVHFAEPDAAGRCKAGLSGREINGKPCVVTLSSGASGPVGASGTATVGARGGMTAGRGGPPGNFPPGRGQGMGGPARGMFRPPGMGPMGGGMSQPPMGRPPGIGMGMGMPGRGMQNMMPMGGRGIGPGRGGMGMGGGMGGGMGPGMMGRGGPNMGGPNMPGMGMGMVGNMGGPGSMPGNMGGPGSMPGNMGGPGSMPGNMGPGNMGGSMGGNMGGNMGPGMGPGGMGSGMGLPSPFTSGGMNGSDGVHMDAKRRRL